ncbi:uncharacterized protein LOC135208959 [Macrobrachium nipponense]|uniref:uncharacterized protein LOC135208959 n=1 Tax=Macrobrachium nipponense TaxID=159736 RepID=UPI0030C8234E
MIVKWLGWLAVACVVRSATCQLSILNPASRNPLNLPPIRSSGGSTSHRSLHALRPLEEDHAPGVVVKKGNISCYSCKLDFRKQEYDMNHPCLGRHNGRNVSDDFLVECGYLDIFCRVERTEVNGILIMLTRECTNTCYYGCRPKGFGINYESCAQCCVTNACNHMYPVSRAAPFASVSRGLIFLMVMMVLGQMIIHWA